MVYLKNYMAADRILFLDTPHKQDALEALTATVSSAAYITDFMKFKKAVFDREALLSTGIGYSVAIPHVKINEVQEFFISVGIHQQGLDWNAIDDKPVNFIFLIGGPNDHQMYLRILAKLTLIIKNPKTRQKLLDCQSKDNVMEIFESF